MTSTKVNMEVLTSSHNFAVEELNWVCLDPSEETEGFTDKALHTYRVQQYQAQQDGQNLVYWPVYRLVARKDFAVTPLVPESRETFNVKEGAVSGWLDWETVKTIMRSDHLSWVESNSWVRESALTATYVGHSTLSEAVVDGSVLLNCYIRNSRLDRVAIRPDTLKKQVAFQHRTILSTVESSSITYSILRECEIDQSALTGVTQSNGSLQVSCSDLYHTVTETGCILQKANLDNCRVVQTHNPRALTAVRGVKLKKALVGHNLFVKLQGAGSRAGDLYGTTVFCELTNKEDSTFHVKVKAGCFTGTVDEFEKEAMESPVTTYPEQYIKLVKSAAELVQAAKEDYEAWLKERQSQETSAAQSEEEGEEA